MYCEYKYHVAEDSGSRLYDRRRKRPIIWGKLTVYALSITFGLYRTYGTLPLRLDPNPVVNGDFNPNNLYMKRSAGSEVMKQIKADLKSSLDYFGNNNSFDPNNRKNLKGYLGQKLPLNIWLLKSTYGMLRFL